MNMRFKTTITIAWCWLTGGTPVYVKKRWRKWTGYRCYENTESVEVRIKVARRKFDPFDENNNNLRIKDKDLVRELMLDGSVDLSETGKWMPVSVSKQVEMKLKQQ